MDEVLETAKQIIEDQSTDYTLGEIDEELDMLSKRGQQVRELLEMGKKDGFFSAIWSPSRHSERCLGRSRHR